MPSNTIITAGIAAAIANAMKRRRKIGILLRNFIMSTSIPTQAILDYYLSLFLSQRLEIKQHLEEWSISTCYMYAVPINYLDYIHGMANAPLNIPNVVYMIIARNDTFGARAYQIFLD